MSFDAVLVISFGGPMGPDDVRPFLANVLRGRRIPPERIEEVAQHYDHFGGVSPLTKYTMEQADGLRQRLAAAGTPLPVYVGMRNWHPLITETMAQMSRDGVRHALGVITAAQKSYSSCGQYKQNVNDAREWLRQHQMRDVDVTYVPNWHAHDLFVESNAQHVREAVARLPEALQGKARLIFTAHSIPQPAAERSHYREQLAESSRLVAERVGANDWILVYQSRSGRPEDPWLGPDITEYLRTAKSEGVEAVVICPIGFVCDHIEVLWDLDHDAANVCRELGIEMRRAESVNADPLFIDMLADVCGRMIEKYKHWRPLPMVSLEGYERREGLPVAGQRPSPHGAPAGHPAGRPGTGGPPPGV
jgi:ferrochelatase